MFSDAEQRSCLEKIAAELERSIGECTKVEPHAGARECLAELAKRSDEALADFEKIIRARIAAWEEEADFRATASKRLRDAGQVFREYRARQCAFEGSSAAGGNAAGDFSLACEVRLNVSRLKHSLDQRTWFAPSPCVSPACESGQPNDSERSSDRRCRGNADLSGECFKMRGRMFAANGAPGIRIWRVGTKRILGVIPNEPPIMPMCLHELAAFGTNIYGDFTVCPFTNEKPGEMQFVCVEEVGDLVVERFAENGEPLKTARAHGCSLEEGSSSAE